MTDKICQEKSARFRTFGILGLVGVTLKPE